jgi:CheY-like chemotaxis protein
VIPKATILIVDDEPEVRGVLEEYFVSHGYAAIGAESADAAKTLAAAQPIDLALVDINMPGEDGLSLARHLRERYANIAIVMLTSAGTVVDRIVGLEMGADDYVPKPFDPPSGRLTRSWNGVLPATEIFIRLCLPLVCSIVGRQRGESICSYQTLITLERVLT